jgi:hypothetical protein
MTKARDLSQVPNASLGFKNRIINGAMMIDQRNAGASVTPTAAAYTLDRWRATVGASSKFSVQQVSDAPSGFVKSLKITSLAATTVGSTDYYEMVHRIEGFNTADLGWGATGAATVTISFWVKSNLTGTFGGALNNSNYTRSYPFNYVISSANTWEYKTVTVAGDTTGTWDTTNGIGINLVFSMGVGSTYSGTAGSWAGADYENATGSVNLVSTNAATWTITGVQLEKGSTATSFDYRPYGTELALCQRYYSFGRGDARGGLNSSGQVGYQYQFVVPMRTTPTITITTISGSPLQAFQRADSFLWYGTNGSTENSGTWVATAEL